MRENFTKIVTNFVFLPLNLRKKKDERIEKQRD